MMDSIKKFEQAFSHYCPTIGRVVMDTLKHMKICLNIRKHLFTIQVIILEQTAHKHYAVSTFEDALNPIRQSWTSSP